jgi:DNA-binding HxlR family transcriptional regulator
MTVTVARSNHTPNLPPADLYRAACPSRGVLEHVTSRWGVLVLILLLEQTHRFSELRRKVEGISEKMLAQTLRALEADGFILREVYPTVPLRVEYSLTALGREIAAQIKVLTGWIEANLPRVMQARKKQQDSQRASELTRS